MRYGRLPKMLIVVSVQAPVDVVLECSRTPGTLSGQLAVDGAAVICFYRWLELIGALERVMGAGVESRQAGDSGERRCEQ
jgi:hypothetical protein